MNFDSRWLIEMPRKEAQELDPFGLDDFFSRLPEMNSKGDVESIIQEVLTLDLPRFPSRNASLSEHLAAMRDLGIIVASLKRHEVDAIKIIPGLSGALAAIAKKTGMVPRDTVLHYCWWNPSGSRQRTFTGAEQERNLIEATSAALPGVE
ncbi:DUF1864 family protein, partial [Streptomyces sp. SID5770]|uniref:monodechloroaminopyrrolnitrin synthase PrnB family protein n=1 Tax=Streptomyces sp. SID5770 TaxID=2690308 RepID=UPI00136FD203